MSVCCRGFRENENVPSFRIISFCNMWMWSAWQHDLDETMAATRESGRDVFSLLPDMSGWEDFPSLPSEYNNFDVDLHQFATADEADLLVDILRQAEGSNHSTVDLTLPEDMSNAPEDLGFEELLNMGEEYDLNGDVAVHDAMILAELGQVQADLDGAILVRDRNERHHLARGHGFQGMVLGRVRMAGPISDYAIDENFFSITGSANGFLTSNVTMGPAPSQQPFTPFGNTSGLQTNTEVR